MMSDDRDEPLNTVQATEPTKTAAPEAIASVGARLREARLAKSLELRDVANKTRQSQDTLAALESMETAHIPNSILRLQARNYARFLGLPEDDVANAFAEQKSAPVAPQRETATAQRAEFPTRLVLIGVGTAIAATVLIAAASVILTQPSTQQTTDQLAISARLAPTNIDELRTLNLDADTGNEFSLRATKAAWIEVRGSDGTVFRSRNMSRGETYFPRTGAGWTITVRDAGAFEWRLGDDVVSTVGEDQQALYSLSVDTVMQEALIAQRAALAEANQATDQAR